MKKEIANCDIPRMQASLSASVRAGTQTWCLLDGYDPAEIIPLKENVTKSESAV